MGVQANGEGSIFITDVNVVGLHAPELDPVGPIFHQVRWSHGWLCGSHLCSCWLLLAGMSATVPSCLMPLPLLNPSPFQPQAAEVGMPHAARGLSNAPLPPKPKPLR